MHFGDYFLLVRLAIFCLLISNLFFVLREREVLFLPTPVARFAIVFLFNFNYNDCIINLNKIIIAVQIDLRYFCIIHR